MIVTKGNFTYAGSTNRSSNKPDIYIKNTPQKERYFVKSYDNNIYILNHILSKHLFNLFSTAKHQSDIIYDDKKYLAIEQIVGYQELQLSNLSCTNTHAYYNELPLYYIYETIIIALLLDDWDIEGNIGIYENKGAYYAIKIDFDESLLKLKESIQEFNEFFKPAGYLLKGCSSKMLLMDAIATITTDLQNLEHIIDQSCVEIKQHFSDEEIYDLHKDIEHDSWRKNFFWQHPIIDIFSSDDAAQHLCNSVSANFKKRLENLVELQEDINVLTDEEFIEKVTNIPSFTNPYKSNRDQLSGINEHDDDEL